MKPVAPKEYKEYLKKLRQEPKPRTVIVPNGECMTDLRLFHKDLGYKELRLSRLVTEESWLPMPYEIFGRIADEMNESAYSGAPLILIGLAGYLGLLTEMDARAAVSYLHDWVDSTSGREAVCLLLGSDAISPIIKTAFENPRYRQGGQLVFIEDGSAGPSSPQVQPEVVVVGAGLAPLIPERCVTFQKYLASVEDDPDSRSPQRIVVASEKPLSGLNAAVKQLTRLRDFAREMHEVEDPGLSEGALRWMCERAKNESAWRKPQETLKEFFFPKGNMAEGALSAFGRCNNDCEREAALWLIRRAAPKGGYLEYAIGQEGVSAATFRPMYVTGASGCLGRAKEYAGERRDAITEANVRLLDWDIREFVRLCEDRPAAHVAPWLNCGTEAEKAELLRRCALDGFVPKETKDVYPEVADYLNADGVFEDEALDAYFREYRELKVLGRVTHEFCEKARLSEPPGSVQYRDEILQRHLADDKCALLVVDCMGAEWLPMLVALAKKMNISVDSVAVAKAKLPTTTEFNRIGWPEGKRLGDVKRSDNIAHDGAEKHERKSPEDNLAAALDVIGNRVLPSVNNGLAQSDRVIVTADHGSSRLAVLAHQAGLVETLPCEGGATIADWRHRERPAVGECPPELEETLDGKHWVVRGYDRLPKKGGGHGFEMHGGATLEERLVPLVVFSKKGRYVAPKAKAPAKRAQMAEEDLGI